MLCTTVLWYTLLCYARQNCAVHYWSELVPHWPSANACGVLDVHARSPFKAFVSAVLSRLCFFFFFSGSLQAIYVVHPTVGLRTAVWALQTFIDPVVSTACICTVYCTLYTVHCILYACMILLIGTASWYARVILMIGTASLHAFVYSARCIMSL